MQEHCCRPRLKTRVLSCAVSVAFCCVFGAFSSCGGGGESATPQEASIRKLLEGRYMMLHGPEDVLVRMAEQKTPRSMVYDCALIWGARGGVCSGVMTVAPGSVVADNEGRVKAVAFTIDFSDSELADSDGFNKFWGGGSADTGGAVRGMKGELSGLETRGSLTQGRFEVVPVSGGKGVSGTSPPVLGDVYIDDTPYAGY